MNDLGKPILTLFTWIILTQLGLGAELPDLGDRFTDAQVTKFARLALDNLEKEYPNKPSHVWTGKEQGHSPRDLHPVFFGSFDWHSCVHGHWMLVRLLKLYPNVEISTAIRSLLDRQLTADKMKGEADYFQRKENRPFERMYGWAWALRLAHELRTWQDPQAKQWAENFAVLEKHIVRSVHEYLPRLTYPIRTGVHRDSAFALGMILDYARAVEDRKLEKLVVDYAMQKYQADQDYPANYEPSGQDFFSSGLNEIDLMRRVMPPEEFAQWLEAFLPGLTDPNSKASKLLQPAVVSDVTDPQIVHLVGLNLSRAWTQRGVASVLASEDPRRQVLESSAQTHCQEGLKYVFSGHYEGEHWLATFAVYLLTDAGIRP